MSVPRQPAASRRGGQLERITRAEERLNTLTSAVEEWKDEFRAHATGITAALRVLQDNEQQRKGAERARNAVTAAIVALVTLAANIIVKLI